MEVVEQLRRELVGRGCEGLDQVEVRAVRGKGFGVFAAHNLDRGFRLTMPVDCLITLETVEASPIFPALRAAWLAADCDSSPSSTLFALFLLCEQARGEASAHHTYIRTLDLAVDSRHDRAVDWTLAERQLLDGSPLAELLSEERRDLETEWAVFFPFLWHREETRDLLTPGRTTLQRFMRAVSCCTSRTFSGAGRGPDSQMAVNMPGVMAPFLDMLNHGIDGNVCDSSFDYEDDDQTRLVLTLGGGCGRGREVLFSYGRKSNAHLLQGYGFVCWPNRFDACEMAARLPPGTPDRRSKCLLLRALAEGGGGWQDEEEKGGGGEGGGGEGRREEEEVADDDEDDDDDGDDDGDDDDGGDGVIDGGDGVIDGDDDDDTDGEVFSKGTFKITLAPLPAQLMALLRVGKSDVRVGAPGSRKWRGVLRSLHAGEPLGAAGEAAALRQLRLYLRQLRAQYTTTCAEDEELLAELQGQGQALDMDLDECELGGPADADSDSGRPALPAAVASSAEDASSIFGGSGTGTGSGDADGAGVGVVSPERAFMAVAVRYSEKAILEHNLRMLDSLVKEAEAVAGESGSGSGSESGTNTDTDTDIDTDTTQDDGGYRHAEPAAAAAATDDDDDGGGGEDTPGTAYSHTAYSLSAEHLDESWQGVFEGEFKKPYFNHLQVRHTRVRTPHHPDLVRSPQL
jgi:hypothetical protein